jgi:uncharacterized protein (UPF0332 family)
MPSEQNVINVGEIFLAKAEECLEGAESEFVNDRYNNCANRCYYACFQAAIVALIRAGIRPMGDQSEWKHDFVQARFASDLINRPKLYPSELRDTLSRTMLLGLTADYEVDSVTQTEAQRVLRRARSFVSAVRMH